MKEYRPNGIIDAEQIGYSHAVEANGQLYVSGQVGWNEAFEIADSFAGQVQLAFENLDTVLEDAGRSRADVAKITAHLVDPPEHAEEFLDQWEQWRPDNSYPCLTILGVDSLAREEFLVELEADVVPVGDTNTR